jgi:hypothetical protein
VRSSSGDGASALARPSIERSVLGERFSGPVRLRRPSALSEAREISVAFDERLVLDGKP